MPGKSLHPASLPAPGRPFPLPFFFRALLFLLTLPPFMSCSVSAST